MQGLLNTYIADDCLHMIKCKDFTSNSRYVKGPEFPREFSLKEVLQTDELVGKMNLPKKLVTQVNHNKQIINLVA